MGLNHVDLGKSIETIYTACILLPKSTQACMVDSYETPHY